MQNADYVDLARFGEPIENEMRADSLLSVSPADIVDSTALLASFGKGFADAPD